MKLLAKPAHLSSIAGLCLMAEDAIGLGFLLGDLSGEDKRLLFPYNIKNMHPNKWAKFLINAKTYVHVEAHAKNRKADIIGIYRAYWAENDDSPPPIEEDEINAQPWYSYLYIPIKKDRSIGIISCYHLNEDYKFEIEEVNLENWKYNG